MKNLPISFKCVCGSTDLVFYEFKTQANIYVRKSPLAKPMFSHVEEQPIMDSNMLYVCNKCGEAQKIPYTKIEQLGGFDSGDLHVLTYELHYKPEDYGVNESVNGSRNADRYVIVIEATLIVTPDLLLSYLKDVMTPESEWLEGVVITRREPTIFAVTCTNWDSLAAVDQVLQGC